MLDTTLNESIIEEWGEGQADESYTNYLPTEKEREVVGSVFSKFRYSADDRNRNFAYFDGLNLIDYIDDSVRRFVTNVDERDDIEDWQASIHEPFTRSKVLATLGKIVSVLPIAEISSRGDEDPRKGNILSNLYEYSEDVDDYDELMIFVLMEAIVKGTAISYEGHTKKVKTRRDVKGAGDEITITENKQTINKLYGGIVPLEQFYPSSVGVRRIKDMPYCFWRNIITFAQFRQDYQQYDRAKYVAPAVHAFQENEKRPFYMDYVSSSVPEGQVEIIRYYNADVDEYVLVANGVWLNPVGDLIISPLPFNHKELPFWDIKYDLFGSDFFYGKSLPDRLKTMQDVLNVLTNMLLDQSFLTIFPPILTSGFDPIEDDYLRPGRRTPVDTQGLPLTQQFLKLDLGTPSGWHQWILEYTRKIMQESSVDNVSQGMAGEKSHVSATEVNTAAMGVASMLGLFARLINYGVKRKALLRCSNILQFWTDKDNPVIQKVLGSKISDFDKAFNSFKLKNGVLTNGKRGMKIIDMYSDTSDVPSKTELKAKAAVLQMQSGKEVEVIAIPVEYLRDIEFDIKLVPNQKNPTSKDIEKALQLEKVRVYMSFFPQIVNVQELAAKTAEIMGDDPTEILLPTAFQQQQNTPDQGAQQSMQDNGKSTQPQGADASNLARKVMLDSNTGVSSSDLQSSLLG